MIADWLKAAMRAGASAAARQLLPTDRVLKELPEWAGFGNQLFFFLWASVQQSRGVDFRLVRSARAGHWLEQFPLLSSQLTIDRAEAPLAARRDPTDWQTISSIGRGSPTTWEDVTQFIHTYLMPSGLFGISKELADGLTLNVRRGDYFSDPDVRGRFSFDQLAYIEVVLDGVEAEGRVPSEIRVVSDDISWCRARLQHLHDRTPSLVFVESTDPIKDLQTVACSRELIIMNSSFSIWAAYISNLLYGDNFEQIHVPAFGTRPFDGRVWPSLNPRWHIVDTIPGGWDS